MKRRLFLLAIIFFGISHSGSAQKLNLQTGGTVEFAPDSQSYFAAIACELPSCLAPTAVTATIGFNLVRQNNRAYSLAVERSVFSSGNEPELYARYTVNGNKSGTFTTTWLPIETLEREIFSLDDPRASVRVEYQMRLRGDEVAGVYEASVSYATPTSTLTHLVRLVATPVITLRLEGALVGAGASLNLDYESAVAAYIQALTTGSPLGVTASDFDRIEVFTNNPSGYSVTVTLVPVSSANGNALGLERVLLFGASADGRVLSSSRSTADFEVLFSPADVAVAVDGSEQPGPYRFELFLNAVMNP